MIDGSHQNWTTKERANNGGKKNNFFIRLTGSESCGLVMHIKGSTFYL